MLLSAPRPPTCRFFSLLNKALLCREGGPPPLGHPCRRDPADQGQNAALFKQEGDHGEGARIPDVTFP
eukprot:4373155-Pyramimonas_sp.AAC.1